jgi:hypothetical protein
MITPFFKGTGLKQAHPGFRDERTSFWSKRFSNPVLMNSSGYIHRAKNRYNR